MDVPPDTIDALVAWAKSKESITKVWLFGSRIKGTNRPDSDLDVAVYLVPSDGEALSEWLNNARDWKTELNGMISEMQIDLQYCSPEATMVVWPAVQDHGFVVFERCGNP